MKSTSESWYESLYLSRDSLKLDLVSDCSPSNAIFDYSHNNSLFRIFIILYLFFILQIVSIFIFKPHLWIFFESIFHPPSDYSLSILLLGVHIEIF